MVGWVPRFSSWHPFKVTRKIRLKWSHLTAKYGLSVPSWWQPFFFQDGWFSTKSLYFQKYMWFQNVSKLWKPAEYLTVSVSVNYWDLFLFFRTVLFSDSVYLEWWLQGGPPSSYKWGYNSSYPFIRPFIGAITLFITSRGPPCRVFS